MLQLKCKKTVHTLSNKILQKSEIIYTRLYEEYDKWNSISDFMAEFKLERQSFYDRKKAKKVDYDEIREVFPEVNLEWLYSNDIKELESLPVRKEDTHDRNILTHNITRLKQMIEDEGIDYNAQADLLLYLQGRTESLSQELAEISFLMERLRYSMKNRSED